MQPYFFPYLGYFQLINAVDKFVFYDDVNYIKSGWINRNNILLNKEKKLITLALMKSSSNKNINEIEIENRGSKLLKTIMQAYAKAPYFCKVFPIIEEIFNAIKPGTLISDVAGLSIVYVSNYLKLKIKFEYSSEKYSDTKSMKKSVRLIEICKRNIADIYINATGGISLYSKEEFKKHNINLYFINNHINEYRQFRNEFIPCLSIIDIMMFNSPEQINKMLNNYEVE